MILIVLAFCVSSISCIYGVAPLKTKVLAPIPQFARPFAQQCVETFKNHLDLPLFDHPGWNTLPNDATRQQILDSVVYTWKNYGFAIHSISTRQSVILQELATMLEHYGIKDNLRLSIETILNSESAGKLNFNSDWWPKGAIFQRMILQPLNDFISPPLLNHYLYNNGSNSIRNGIFPVKRFTARTWAIGTYNLVQIAFLLNQKIDVDINPMAVYSSQSETLLHIADTFKICLNIINYYLGALDRSQLTALWRIKDDFGISPEYRFKLENEQRKIKTDAFFGGQYERKLAELELMDRIMQNEDVKNIDNVENIDKNKSVLNRDNFIINLCIVSCVMATFLIVNIILYIVKYAQLLSSVKLIFITGICSGISWIQCINQYLKYFNFCSDKKYHFFSKYLIQSLFYLYGGIVMLLILNVCITIVYFSVKIQINITCTIIINI